MKSNSKTFFLTWRSSVPEIIIEGLLGSRHEDDLAPVLREISV